MKKNMFVALALASFAGMASAQTYTIDFEKDALGNNLSELQTIDNEYAAWGVNFVPNVLSGATWATNTDMRVSATDVGGGYLASYGKILHTFSGWLNEDNDPNFGMFFDAPISDITVRFTGEFDFLSEVALFDTNGNFLQSQVATGNANLSSVTFTGLSNTNIAVVAPGWFGDWVGVVDITYTLVPAPSSLGMLGLAGLVAGRRRR